MRRAGCRAAGLVVRRRASNSTMSQTQVKSAAQKASRHVNDWPNDAGFQVDVEQRKPVALKIVGSFPAGVAGTLVRTGPGSYRTALDSGTGKDGEFRLSHWFDGWSQVYRFQLLPQANGTCRVLYNSRRQVDEQLARVKQTGRLDGITFGQKRDQFWLAWGHEHWCDHPPGGP
jgi:torulene dioxygenase